MDDVLMIPALDVLTGKIEERPMRDDERAEFLAAREAGRGDEIVLARDRRMREILELLRDTDKWAARAVEDGQPMRADRIAYRQELRKLLAVVETSDDPASIELPKGPA
jgi:hypothetical protein